MTKRYAEGTTVGVDSSRAEITGILTKHGCLRMAWGMEPDGDTLQFELGGKLFRFKIPKPTLPEVRQMYPNAYDWDAKLQAEWRRRWRAHVLLIKAKLEFIDGGDTTLEREFMPYIVLPSGQTLGEYVDAGGMKLLSAGS